MAAIPPASLTIGRQQLTVLEHVFTAARPVEGCALLLGCTAPGWQLRQVWPCLNVWPVPAERQRRFALDPREQLLAQRWGRQRGLQVLGCAHSHPSSAPEPSALDRELTLPPALLLIAGQHLGANEPQASPPAPGWQWACWWLPEAEPGQAAATAMPVPWRMVADSEVATVAASPVAHASS